MLLSVCLWNAFVVSIHLTYLSLQHPKSIWSISELKKKQGIKQVELNKMINLGGRHGGQWVW